MSEKDRWVMFIWGNEIHIAPSNDGEEPAPPHKLSADCPCHPDLAKQSGPVSGYVHNEIN